MLAAVGVYVSRISRCMSLVSCQSRRAVVNVRLLVVPSSVFSLVKKKSDAFDVVEYTICTTNIIIGCTVGVKCSGILEIIIS